MQNQAHQQPETVSALSESPTTSLAGPLPECLGYPQMYIENTLKNDAAHIHGVIRKDHGHTTFAKCRAKNPKTVVQVRLTKNIVQDCPEQPCTDAPTAISGLDHVFRTAKKLSKFYENYVAAAEMLGEQSNIIPRDAMHIMARMGDHAVFSCERLHDDPDRTEIVAGSILWRHEMPVPSFGPNAIHGYETASFMEFGTQVCILNGFALQWVMTAVTILERLALDPTGIFVAATYGDNHRAANNFLATMRFAEWHQAPATWNSLRLHCHRRAGREGRGLRWFRPTVHTLLAAADLLIDLCEQPHRTVSPRVWQPEVPGIRFSFDDDTFRLVGFGKIKALAEQLGHARPCTLSSLRDVLGGRHVGEAFIQWPTS